MKRKVVFILGPTGSGKTALAVKLAKKFNGEIISADSRQIYKRLDVGSGKEGKPVELAKTSRLSAGRRIARRIEENARYIGRIPQYMIDVAEPEEKFTLFDWLEGARLVLEDIFSRGKLPIVVGGTGLYAKSLAEGFCIIHNSKIKNQNFGVSQARRLFSREELDEMSLEQLQKIYLQLQTTDHKLDLRNPRRLVRAIEKAQEGIVTTKEKPDFESLILAIDLDRKELYKRIDKRVDDRFGKQRMLEEVVELLSSGVSEGWLRSLGLEYRIISRFLINEGSRLHSNNKDKIASSASGGLAMTKDKEFQEMVQELKWKTHAYARRQLTWLRKLRGIVWMENSKQVVKLVEKFVD